MSVSEMIFAPDTVESLAQALFSHDVAVALSFPWEAAEGAFPEEVACLRAPNAKRLAEFAAGRRAAHEAMATLGAPVRAVMAGPDRAPVWPQGLVGSLSHTDTTCLAVVGYATRHAALGLDVELDEDLPEDLFREVCTPSELAWLSVQDVALRGRLARLIFSAKEAAYKLQYPLSRMLLGFDAFEITPDLETGQFEATLTRDVAPFKARQQFSGRFAFGAGLILTGLALPQAQQPLTETL